MFGTHQDDPSLGRESLVYVVSCYVHMCYVLDSFVVNLSATTCQDVPSLGRESLVLVCGQLMRHMHV